MILGMCPRYKLKEKPFDESSMEIKTHVLTNEQHLDDNRKAMARKNIDAAKKAEYTHEGNLAGFDANGELVDSGIANNKVIQGVSRKIEGQPAEPLTPVDGVVTIVIPAGVDVSGKADKVAGAHEGNFAGLDGTGNLTDSGKSASDFATAAQGELADTAVQDPNYVHTDTNYTAAEKTKLGTVSEGANKVEASQTNGNIKIDNVETTVYTHPTTDVVTAAAVKVGNDAEGHVVIGDPLVKGDVGLGNVDNTSDADKPISTATQAALDLKVDKEAGKGLSTNDFTDAYKDDVDANTLARHTHSNQQILDNTTASYTSEEQGKLSGISNGANKVEASQTNGNIKIDNVETTVYEHPTTTAVIAAAVNVGKDAYGHVVIGEPLDQGDVGLGNVDNTSDADKPISTATQAALDLKVDKEVGKGLSTNDFTDAYKADVDANTLARHTHANQQILDDTTASYTSEEKTKLGSIDAGAQVNVIETVKVDGTALTVTDKSVDIVGKEDVSNKVTSWSQPTTDVNYPSEKLVKDSLDDKVDKEAGKGLVVEPDPNTPSTILGYRGDGTSDPDPDWRVIAKSTFGASPEILDEQTGEPIVDENATDLWATYDGTGFGAERAVADRIGQVIDETYATKTDVANKADKVTGATSGNFAGLDSNGNLTDSGKSASDFKPTQTAVSDPTADGNALSFIDTISQDANGVITPTKKTVPDGTTSQKGVIQLTSTVNATGSTSATLVPTETAVRTAIDSAVSSAYHHAGTKRADELLSSLLVAANEGNVYNISEAGTTTADFIEGAGKDIRVGDNVGVCQVSDGVYKFDLLSGIVDLSNYKTKQTAVVDPTASGNGLDFIASISQDANGEITPTKQTVQDGTTSQKGVVQLEDSHTSTSTTKAATPNSVKEAYDLAAGKQDPITFDGTYDATDNPAATVSTVTTAIADKADKVISATSGNFAGLDANGNLTDSGKSASDFKPKQTAVTDPTADGNAVSFIDTISQDADGVITPTKKTVPNASYDDTATPTTYVDGLMTGQDKEKLDGIEAGAEENDVETISIGGGTPISPTANTTNIDIPMAAYTSGATPTYTDGAMDGQDKKKLDELKNFSSIVLTDGISPLPIATVVPTDHNSALKLQAGANIALSSSPNVDPDTVIISAASNPVTVSGGKGINVTTSIDPYSSATDYEVSVNGALGCIGGTSSVNVTATDCDAISLPMTAAFDAGNDRFIIQEDATDHHVYLYALKTVSGQTPATRVDGVDIFTVTFNVNLTRAAIQSGVTQHGFYGLAGIKVLRKHSSSVVLADSSESYAAEVGAASINLTVTIQNNSGTETIINSKSYYGYRFVYYGDVPELDPTTSDPIETIELVSRLTSIEETVGIAEYNGAIPVYTAGTAIDMTSDVVSVQYNRGLQVNSNNQLEVRLGEGLDYLPDPQNPAIIAIGIHNDVEEVVEEVKELETTINITVTTNMDFADITGKYDLSTDGSSTGNGVLLGYAFTVPLANQLYLDDVANEWVTKIGVYASQLYSQNYCIIGIYEFDFNQHPVPVSQDYPTGLAGYTVPLCDTGRVQLHEGLNEFSIKHMNNNSETELSFKPDCIYYAAIYISKNSGQGVSLAGKTGYVDPFNTSLPVMSLDMCNINIDLSDSSKTATELDAISFNDFGWWSGSGDTGAYHECPNAHRFFMMVRNIKTV